MIDPFSFVCGAVASLVLLPIARLTYRIYPYLLPPKKIHLQAKTNQYIVVSGATDGIGLEYVKYLAGLGCNIVAIGRDVNKLEQLSSSFKTVKTTLFDYDKDKGPQGSSIDNNLFLPQHCVHQGMKIKGIINCAGIAHFSRYDHLTVQQINKVKRVNLNSIHFTLNVLKTMTSAKRIAQHPFYINVSSAVVESPQKYSCVYAATKAYQSHLLKCISIEDGAVQYLDVRPWYVKTKMVGYQDSWDSVPAQKIVDGSLRVLGRREQCNGCLKHEVLSEFSFIWRSLLQRRLQDKMQRMVKMRQLRKKKSTK